MATIWNWDGSAVSPGQMGRDLGELVRIHGEDEVARRLEVLAHDQQQRKYGHRALVRDWARFDGLAESPLMRTIRAGVLGGLSHD